MKLMFRSLFSMGEKWQVMNYGNLSHGIDPESSKELSVDYNFQPGRNRNSVDIMMAYNTSNHKNCE